MSVAHATKTSAERSRARAASSRSASQPDLPVRVSHPDKVYWPEEGYTKLDLILFYDRVWSELQPYVRDRLLSLERCPDGMAGSCFFQKEMPKGLPPGTPSKRIKHANGVTKYVVGGRRETQLALANLGAIAVHVWGARARQPRKPDWVCFDLDPDSGKFSDAARAALRLKKALDVIELVSFVKTSGGKGLHVFVPIRVGPDANDVLGFARQLGALLAKQYPRELTMESSIAARRGRVYLDPFRNAFGQTVVAPYSVRRRPHAPVSTPLDWSEVKPTLDPTRFNLGNFHRRLQKKDPWEKFFQSRQSLTRYLRALEMRA